MRTDILIVAAGEKYDINVRRNSDVNVLMKSDKLQVWEAVAEFR